MADRHRQIAALRAKAASTSFPAEAEACRAKADELEALEPAPEPAMTYLGGFRINVGDLWGAAGGVQVRVTNVGGSSYTIRVE